jgi:hypothetical protein
MLYFIVTAYVNSNPLRQEQYINAINKLKEVLCNNNFVDYEIIIVENNGQRETYLDTLGCKVHYTNNNWISINNNGVKEIKDVWSCIDAYNIQDNDFIVKMTGRYLLNDDSQFIAEVQKLNDTRYDCIIRYGSFNGPVNYQMEDCITGLIGMRSSYIKQIELLREGCIEWNWAKVTYKMEKDKICILDTLGINICPGSNTYFLV